VSGITFGALVDRLGPAVRHGSPFDVRVRCPRCDHRSLAVREREGEPLLVYCHDCRAGFREVLDLLGEIPERPATTPRPAAVERPPRPVPLRIGAPYPGTDRAIIRAFGYEDEHGIVRYSNLRLDGDRAKFRMARPVESIRWDSPDLMLSRTLWHVGYGCMDGIERVLYRLPIVRAIASEGGAILIMEGERDAEAWNADPDTPHTTVATTSGGTGSWCDEFTELLRGASEVRVYADPDPQGLEHARDVARRLKRAGLPVTLLVPKSRTT